MCKLKFNKCYFSDYYMAATLSPATLQKPLSLQTIQTTQVESCLAMTLFCYKCISDVIIRVTTSDALSKNINKEDFTEISQNFTSICQIELSAGKLEISIEATGSVGTVYLKSIDILVGQCDTLGMYNFESSYTT